MKKTKYNFLIILIPIIAFGLGIGVYFLNQNRMIERNIDLMQTENDLFYTLLFEEHIDIGDNVLYDLVIYEDGTYYIIFTEAATALYEEGDVINGVLLEIQSDIYTEYNSDIELSMDVVNEHYTLLYLWLAGGGSSYTSSISFYKRAELRRLVIENQTNIIRQDITIKITGSLCLGKLEID